MRRPEQLKPTVRNSFEFRSISLDSERSFISTFIPMPGRWKAELWAKDDHSPGMPEVVPCPKRSGRRSRLSHRALSTVLPAIGQPLLFRDGSIPPTPLRLFGLRLELVGPRGTPVRCRAAVLKPSTAPVSTSTTIFETFT